MRADDLLNELSYKQNIGAMETYKFYSVATPEQKYELKRLIAEKNFKEAWHLIKQVTGVELQDLGNESITDYEKAVMEGGHSLEEPVRQSALREAVELAELTGWKLSQPQPKKKEQSKPNTILYKKDTRSELQKMKDSGNKNWFRIKEESTPGIDESTDDQHKLVIFDIDDTLVHTQTKVHVVKDGTVVKSLNSHEFTHYKLKPNEYFDFGDFRDAREFFANAKPIIPMINQLKRDINTGNKVVMVTARADFNDRELFLDTFRKYGINMRKVHVYRAGNLKDGSTEDRKKRIIGSLLSAEDYSKAIMYDDALPNLDSFISLKQDFPSTKFYAWHVSLDGVASEYHRTDEQRVAEDELEEDWKSTAASLAAAAGIAGAGYGGMAAKQSIGNYFKEPVPATQQVKAFTPKIDTTTLQAKKQEQPKVKSPQAKPIPKKAEVKPITNNPLESKLLAIAKQSGLAGTELAAFMAQCAHETLDFKRMVEFGGKLDFRKYDPKHAPKKAKALGNKQVGDGERYKGRGFIQLTGRYNYKKAGEELGLPLEQKPQLVEDPEIAAKVAVWFWKHRVQPNVDNFHDVVDVTKYINPAMRGLKDRSENFKQYMSAADQPGKQV